MAMAAVPTTSIDNTTRNVNSNLRNMIDRTIQVRRSTVEHLRKLFSAVQVKTECARVCNTVKTAIDIDKKNIRSLELIWRGHFGTPLSVGNPDFDKVNDKIKSSDTFMKDSVKLGISQGGEVALEVTHLLLSCLQENKNVAMSYLEIMANFLEYEIEALQLRSSENYVCRTSKESFIADVVALEASSMTHNSDPDVGEPESIQECLICCEGPADVILHPCAHKNVCSGCADELIAREMPCPVCRTKIETTSACQMPGYVNGNTSSLQINFDNTQNKTCLNCDDNHVDCFLVPCGHTNMCRQCVGQNIQNGLTCMDCNLPIETTQALGARNPAPLPSRVQNQDIFGFVGPRRKGRPRCLICHERGSNHILEPCGHQVMCGRCAWFQLRNHGECPQCDTDIENIIKVPNE